MTSLCNFSALSYERFYWCMSYDTLLKYTRVESVHDHLVPVSPNSNTHLSVRGSDFIRNRVEV